VISVWDTGIGIPPEEQSKIFRAFYQIDSSLVRSQQGTGLGLSLVCKIAELHGGKVWLESEIAGGSRFYVELPQRDIAAAPASARSRPAMAPVAIQPPPACPPGSPATPAESLLVRS
jgi:K+-sensing histidine kinase KdpD